MPETDLSHFGFFLLRAPVYHKAIAHWISEPEPEAVIADRLLELYQLPYVKDAIFLASPAFFSQLEQEVENGKPGKKYLLTLYKYLTRMATRATPYGKFSGIALGEINRDATRMIKNGRPEPFLRFDMELVAELSRKTVVENSIKETSTYFPNGTIYKCLGEYRYYEYTYQNGKRNYYLAVSRSTRVLDFILEAVSQGSTYIDLIQRLEDAGINREGAMTVVDKLIENQILLSDFEVNVTGREYSRFLLDKLAISGSKEKADTLKTLRKRFSEPAFPAKPHLELEPLKRQFGDKVLNPFQVDTKLNMESTVINQNLVDTIISEVQELICLGGITSSNEMEKFKRQFHERYGSKEVDLMIAIDPDLGIGYGENICGSSGLDPIINNVGFQRKPTSSSPTLPDDIKTVMAGWSMGKQDLQLNLEDSRFNHFFDEKNLEKVPPSFYVFGNLLSTENSLKGDESFNFHLNGVGGVSALPLMSRFSHLDENIEKRLQDVAEYERASMEGTILAEIVHLPQSKTGNILQRPCFFEYEIPILANSTLPRENQIHPADLTLRIVNGNLVMRSKRLNQIVIPRLSNAHNHANGISVYRFLSDLQYEGWSAGWKWQWQDTGLDFRPRLTYKHLVLARAQWTLKKNVYDKLAHLSVASVFPYLKENFGTPKLVQLIEGDNELLLNLESSFGVSTLLDHLKRRNALLMEVLPAQAETLMDIHGNCFQNEIILPVRSTNSFSSQKGEPDTQVSNIQRVFTPGQRWTYLKLYCSMRQSDSLLADSLHKLTTHLKENGIIEGFFFVRYYDPEPHLRIRFKCTETSTNAFSEIADYINSTTKHLIELGVISRIKYDTYDREIERYGERYMEYCEGLFMLDSYSVIQFLQLHPHRELRMSAAWLFATKEIDALLTLHGYDLEGKSSFVKKLRDGFLAEFEGGKEISRRLNDSYRGIKPEMEALFNGHLTSSKLNNIHQLAHGKIRTAGSLLKSQIALHGKLDNYFYSSTLPSLCHMTINRIFPNKQRESELAVYHFLEKIYQHQLAVNKKAMQLYV